MFFGTVPVSEAEGGLTAHRIEAGGTVLPKGHALSAADCRALAVAGVERVVIARLEMGDIGEDEAARRLAGAVGDLRRAEAFTGRVNLFAEADGVLVVDAALVDAFNAIDEGMTLATLPPFRRVRAGEMVATVKIIPFALPEAIVDAGKSALAGKALRVAPFRPKRVALLLLALPGTKPSVLAKTERVTRERIESLGGTLVSVERLAHDSEALKAGIGALAGAEWDMLIIFGAAAIADRRDVIPQAIEACGGRIEHLGMPVDPGNLLLLGEVHGRPVIGAPGCARSPAENGFDWVLERLSAGLAVTSADLRRMGAGGLLMEIISRPQPRAGEG